MGDRKPVKLDNSSPVRGAAYTIENGNFWEVYGAHEIPYLMTQAGYSLNELQVRRSAGFECVQIVKIMAKRAPVVLFLSVLREATASDCRNKKNGRPSGLDVTVACVDEFLPSGFDSSQCVEFERLDFHSPLVNRLVDVTFYALEHHRP